MSAPYDLAVNLPLRSGVAARLHEALAGFPMHVDILGYPPAQGSLAVREAIAGWMRRHGGHSAVDPRQLVLTLGGRHALSLALDETCAPGDTLLMEGPTYHGFRTAAQARGVLVADVAMDSHGMLPDALDRVAASTGARTVYIQPTLQNPTTSTMPLARRHEILRVVAERDLTVIEGDVYAALAWHGREPLPALADLAPERCFHAGGIGKILGPGLRVGWLLLPDDASRDRVSESIRLESDGVPALLPAVVAGWMADGTADLLLANLATAMHERNRLARSIVGDDLLTAGGLHAWLPTDDAEGIESRAAAGGVRLTPSRMLQVAGEPARGIRLCLGAEESTGRLEAALRIVAESR